MPKYIKCVPSLNIIQKEKIKNLLTTLHTDEEFTKSIIDIVLDSNPEFIADEKSYTLSDTGKFNQLPEELQSLLNEVIAIIGKRAGVDRTALQNELRVRSSVPVIETSSKVITNEASDNISEDLDDSNNEFSDDESNQVASNSQAELNEVSAKEIFILRGKPTYAEILKWYFPIDQRTNVLQEEFTQFFKTTFINSIYGDKLGDTFFNTPKQAQRAFIKQLEELQSNTNVIDSGNNLVNFLNDSNIDDRKAFYAYLSNTYFENLSKELLPGLQSELKKSSTFNSKDVAISNFESMDKFAKTFLNNTPRLSVNTDGSKFSFSFQKSDSELANTTLSDNDLRIVFGLIAQLDNRSEVEFNNDFKELLSEHSGQVRDILYSLYNKFFSDESYTVDGEEFQSLKMLKDNTDNIDAHNLLNSVRSNLSSSIVNNYIFSSNGSTVFTNSLIADASSKLIDNVKNGLIVTSNGKEILDNNVLNSIKFDANDSGDLVCTINIPGKPAINIVMAKELQGNDKLFVKAENNIANQRLDSNYQSILKHLLGASNLLASNKKLLGMYRRLTSDISNPIHSSYNTTDLILNIAWVLKSFDKNSAEELNKFASIESKAAREVLFNETLENTSDILFDALDKGYDVSGSGSKAFTSLLMTAAEQALSLDAPQTILDIENNSVALSSNVTKQKVTNQYIKQINKILKLNNIVEDQYKQKPLLINNSFIGKSAKYKFSNIYTLNGVIKGDKKRAFKNMTSREAHSYLIEDIFAKSIIQSKGNQAALLSTIFADKSKHDVNMFERTSKAIEFIPVTEVNGSKKLNTELLKSELVKTRKTFHNDLANQIVENWKKTLDKLSIDNSDITNLPQLVSKLSEIKLPASIIEGTDLIADIEYTTVEKDGVKFASINPVFQYQYKVWNDNSLANDYIKNLKSHFIASLKESNYLDEKGHLNHKMSPEISSFIRNKFGFDNNMALIEAFFFNSLIINEEFNNIAGALYYQSTNGLVKSDTKERIEEEFNHVVEEKLKKREAKGNKKPLSDIELQNIRIEVTMSIGDQIMYSDFVKRMGPQASTGHRPSLKGKDEKGMFLEEYSYNAVIKDPELKIELLGSLDNNQDFKIYDAFTFGYPFYRDKINNGLGNSDIHVTNAGAFKTLNNSKDLINGYTTTQKNVVMPLTSELISNSPAMQNLFIKMGSSVLFSEKGLEPVEVNGEICNNVHDIFKANGGFTDFEDALELTKEFLAENPAYRSAYIETVTLPSAQKRGVSNVNSSSAFHDNTLLNYQKIPNTHLITILNLEHNPDTTASLTSKDHDSEVSALTQAFSSAVNEGGTKELSLELFDTLGKLSSHQFDIINRNVKYKAVELLENVYTKFGDSSVDLEEREKVLLLTGLYKTQSELSEEDNTELDNFIAKHKLIEKSTKEFLRDLSKDALKSREIDGPGTQLLSEEDVTFEALQLSGVTYTALSTYLEKLAVRMKFAGGQQVVAPTHNLMKLYTTKSDARMNRADYNKYAEKNTEITSENLHQYLMTDLVSVNGSEPVALDSVVDLIGLGDSFKGVDFSQNGENLNMMNYYKLDEEGNKFYISDTKYYDDLKNETEPEKRRILENLLQSKLNEGEWFTEATEFFGPCLHLSAYNLKLNDTLHDIFGDLDYTNIENRQAVIDNSTEFFKKRLEYMATDFSELAKLSELKNPTAILLNLFNNKIETKWLINPFNKSLDVNNLIKKISANTGNINENLKDSFLDYIETELSKKEKELIAAGEDSNDGLNYTDILSEIQLLGRNYSSQFINKLAEKQGNNFFKTLTFFTGRIPGQAKQSATVGQIKGFINSTANTMYSPAAFSHLTGQDHDGDKLNTIAYSVDEFGVIYDYSKYTTNGKLDNAKIIEAKDNIIKELTKSLDKITRKVAQRESFKNKSKEDIALEANRILQSKIKKALDNEDEYISNALKNKVLDTLINVWSSPRNAVESQRPISMAALTKAIPRKTKTITVESEEKGDTDATVLSVNINKDNPAMIPVFVDILLSGKDVIGVEANFLKALSAWSLAYTSDSNNKALKFSVNDHLMALGVKDSKDSSEEFVIYNYDANGDLQRKVSTRLADTDNLNFHDKDLEDRKKLFEHFKASEQYKAIIAQYNESEAVVFEAYLMDAYTDKNLSLVKANDYISQLLSAATDNAKEFILGRIGADSVTSGIISTGILLGFELSDMMVIINDETVQELLKEAKESKSTFSSKKLTSFSTLVEKYVKYKMNGLEKRNMKSDEIISSLQSKLAELSTVKKSEDYIKEGFKENSVNVFSQPYNLNNKTPKINDAVLSEFLKIYNQPINDNIKNILAAFEYGDTVVMNFNAGNYELAMSKVAKLLNKHILFTDTLGNFRPTSSMGRIPLLKGDYVVATDVNVDALLKDALSNNKNFYELDPKGTGSIFDANNKTKLDETQASIDNEVKYKLNNTNEILNNKVRQLDMFLKAKKGLSGLSKVLSVNQGLNSTVEEAFIYLTEVSKVLGVPVKGLEKRLDELSNGIYKISEDEHGYPDSVFSIFDLGFILSKNKAAINNLKAEVLKYNTINSTNKMTQALHSVLAGVTTEDIEELQNLEQDKSDDTLDKNSENRLKELQEVIGSKFYAADVEVVKDVKQFIYDYSIDTFYNNNQSIISFDLNVNDRKAIYDLSINSERENFINELPNIIEQLFNKVPDLADVDFLKKVKPDSVFDKKTNKKSIYLKPLSRLSSLSPGQKSILENSFASLKHHENNDVKNLYNALNHYALIVYSGGRSVNSFASLTDQNDDLWKSYYKSLKEFNLEKLHRDLQSVDKYVSLLVPSSIKSLSTSSSRYNEDLEVVISTLYSMPKIKDTCPNIFRSIELNEIFVLSKDIEGNPKYLPVTMKYNSKAINFSFNELTLGMLDKLGYTLGKPAVINEKGDIGSVLYSSFDGYVALNQYGKMFEITDVDALKSWNPSMKFKGPDFGYKKSFEIGQIKDPELNIKFTKAEIDDLTNNVNYKIISYLDESIEPNTMLVNNKTGYYGDQAIKYSIKYEGEFTASDLKNQKIAANFSNLDKFKLSTDKTTKYKVIKVMLMNSPAIVKGEYSKIASGSFNHKVINMNSSYLITDRNELKDVIQLSTVRDNYKYSTFRKAVEGSEAISLSDFFKNEGTTRAKNLLGLTDREISNIQSSGKQMFVYKVLPADARNTMTNSLQEMNTLTSFEAPLLQDVTIYKETSLNKDLFEKYGAAFKKLEDVKNVHVTLASQIKSKLDKDFSNLQGLGDFINAVASNDIETIILHTDLFNNHYDNLNKNAKDVLLNNKKKPDGMSNAAFENAIRDIELFEERNSETDQFSSRGNSIQLKAAQYSGKIFNVYDTYNNQWMTYTEDGKFEKCRIPTIQGGVLYLNSDNLVNPRITETLLLKTNRQNEINDDHIGDVNSIREFAFESLESNSAINESLKAYTNDNVKEFKELDTDLLNTTIYSHKASKDQVEGVDYILEGGRKRYLVPFKNGKVLESDFIQYKNVAIKSFKDGCLLVTLSTENDEKTYAFIPSELEKAYGNFKGEKVYSLENGGKGFKFSIPSKNLFVSFDKLHKINNVKAFELRDQLIEEKVKTKELYDIANNYLNNDIRVLYRAIRFPKGMTLTRSKRFEGIKGYKAFVNAIQLDTFKDLLTIEEKVLALELIEKDKTYKELLHSAQEFKSSIERKYTSKVVIKNSNLNFDVNDKNHVLVIPTLKGKTESLLSNALGSRYTLNNKEGKSGDRMYNLPMFSMFNDKQAILNDTDVLANTLHDLTKQALKEPSKTFFFTLNNGLNGKLVSETLNVDGNTLAFGLARAISRATQSIQNWPSNLVLDPALVKFINSNDGFTNLQRINKTKNFNVISASDNDEGFKMNNASFLEMPMDPSFPETKVGDIWAKWKGLTKFDHTTMYTPSVNSNTFAVEVYGSDKKAFSALVEKWGYLNPKKLNSIAAKIGTKNLVNYNSKEQFSAVTALAELLNNKFVNNNSLSIETQNTDIEVNDKQSLIALGRKDVNFENGEAIIKAKDGELYHLNIINNNHKRLQPGSIWPEFSDALVVEPELIYKDNFILANIKKLDSVISKKYIYSAGQLKEELGSLVNDMTLEQQFNVENATHILPIDINSNVTELAEDRTSGNIRITNIVKAIKNNINTNYDSNSKIMLIGTTLDESVYRMQDIQNVVGAYRKFLDRAMGSKATFLIDKETGVTEQLKAYILNNPSYKVVGNELKIAEPVKVQSTERIYIYSDKSQFLNVNNGLNRNQTISGLLQTYKNNSKGMIPYNVLNISKSDKISWYSKMDTDFLNKELTISETGNLFVEKSISEAVEINKSYLNNLIRAHILFKNDIEFKKDMLSLIYSEVNLKAEYDKITSDVFNFFNDTRLRIALRDKSIMFNYLNEHFPFLLNENNQVFVQKISSIEIFDKDSKIELLKQNLSSDFINSIAKEANTIEDVFYLLSSTKNILFGAKGRLEGQIAAKIIAKNLPDVKAFETNNGLLIIDHNLVDLIGPANSEYDGKDSNSISKKVISNNIENILNNKFNQLYKYMKKNGMLFNSQVDNNTVYFNFNDKITELNVSSDLDASAVENKVADVVNTVKSEIYNKIKNQYNDYIDSNETLSTEYTGDTLSALHVRQNKPLSGNPWLSYFSKHNQEQAPEVLDLISISSQNKIFSFKEGDIDISFMNVRLSPNFKTVIYKESGSDLLKIAKIDKGLETKRPQDILKAEVIGTINGVQDFTEKIFDKPISDNPANRGKTFSQLFTGEQIVKGKFKLTYDNKVVSLDENNEIINAYVPSSEVGANLSKWDPITKEELDNARQKPLEVFKNGDSLDLYCSIP